MRLTEKQVIDFEQAEKAQQLLDKGEITLGEFETMVQANNKEITVTLTEKSHKHAEMMIHRTVNPELVVFYKSEWLGGVAWIEVDCPNWNAGEYFLCHPNHEKECLHWLNGGDVQLQDFPTNDFNDYLDEKCEWSLELWWMSEQCNIRIKQEPEYVKVESIFDLNRDEQYYCNSTGKSYAPIGQYPSEQYLVAQLENNNLYRKVEKGE